jgi:DNA-binding LacI/PurR family transcriptional regulator
MKPFHPLSTVEQLAAHLRAEIAAGRLGGTMPGVAKLVEKLGVGTKTAAGAMAALERQGVLKGQGARRGSRIVAPGKGGIRALRVVILLYHGSNASEGFLVDLRHRLQQAGHSASFSSKSLIELGMDADRVARFVKKTPADAWVVFVGSRPVLDWFASQPFPSFALLGRGANVDIAGLSVSKTSAMSEILHRLVQIGHRRIVLMTPEERRKPEPGALERHYLAELEALGIPSGPYNLPNWESNPRSFHARLAALFAHSPPSAILFDVPMLFTGAQQFFTRHGLRIPDDVSTITLDGDPSFAWCDPVPTHLDTDPSQWVNKVMRWVGNAARGKEDRRKTVVQAGLAEGGTIGPARPRPSK